MGGLGQVGSDNTAIGAFALGANSPFGGVGNGNVAIGSDTLVGNQGNLNTAVGHEALLRNSTGNFNTAMGDGALSSNNSGGLNTGLGTGALFNNTTGFLNIALGLGAGFNVTTANNVICIGNGGQNVSNSCYIGQIFGATSSEGTAVFINSDGRLGTSTSSRRFKEEIKPMERASETLFALKPATFRYKKEIDRAGIAQFGLVAEEVEKVNPDLVVRDKEGKPYTVRYEAVNAMLLNEFLKEHRKVEEQEATITELTSTVAQQRKDFEATTARHQKEIQALTASVKEQSVQIQKVSAQLKMSRPAAVTVLNNR
jgi:uncharacterized coiled-coil protein SlyX